MWRPLRAREALARRTPARPPRAATLARGLLFALCAALLLCAPRPSSADAGMDAAAEPALPPRERSLGDAARAIDASSPRLSLDARAGAAAPESLPAAPARDASVSALVPHAEAARPRAAHAAEARPRPTLGQVVRIALGLCSLLALVLLAGHRSVAQFERQLGLSMLAGTGVPFLLLGALCAHPSIGVLTPAVLTDLRPALEFGLGWIGLRIGSEFDVREFDRLPRGTTRLLGAETGLAFLLSGGSTALALAAYGGSTPEQFLRDAALLGACAAVSAPTGARLLEARGLMQPLEAKMLRRVTRLDDALALLALAVVNAVFHPANGAAARAHLPPLGWVFLQIGMGATLGFVLYAFRATATKILEQNALTFGAVAFLAGMAGYLGFSPLVVAFVAGVVVTNVTRGRGLGAFGEQLVALERPMFVLFFTIVGASWSLGSTRAWLVIPLFVLARWLGKSVGVRLATAAGALLERRAKPLSSAPPRASLVPPPEGAEEQPLLEVSDPRLAVLALTPSSVVAVALVTSARAQYPDLAPFVLTVVIVGGALAELSTQLGVARALRQRGPSAPPQEEKR